MTITFNILGFNQEKLMKLTSEKNININGNDLIVLRNIVDMMKRMQTKEFDGEIYSWIKYSLLVENLPIISTKEDTFKKIVTKLIKCDLLKRKIIKYVGHGTYTYFKATKTLDELLYVDDKQKTSLNEANDKFKNIDTPNINKTKRFIKDSSTKSSKNIQSQPSSIGFNNFKSRKYDYDKLELFLLGWDDTLNLDDCML